MSFFPAFVIDFTFNCMLIYLHHSRNKKHCANININNNKNNSTKKNLFLFIFAQIQYPTEFDGKKTR